MSPAGDIATAPTTPPGEGPVLLFDGVCNLCSSSVQLVLDHERAPTLRFASLGSEAALALLERRVGSAAAATLLGAGGAAPDSLVLVEGARVFTESTAALRVARHLRAPLRWLAVLLLVPRPFRDAVYRGIAARRYRWFGRADACRAPSPALRGRLLDDAPREDC